MKKPAKRKPKVRATRRRADTVIRVPAEVIPRKPRRVVLGVGHPWFSIGTIGEFGSGWVTVQLKEKDSYLAWNKALRLSDLGSYNRIRLVAEVLK